jgi:hypothetical protein
MIMFNVFNAVIQLDADLIDQLHAEIEQLQATYGDQRGVGPVTLEWSEDTGLGIIIEVEKQGRLAYALDEMGRLYMLDKA